MMLEALALAAWLAGGFAERPAGLALAVYVSCEPGDRDRRRGRT